jgi:hypothetical protein
LLSKINHPKWYGSTSGGYVIKNNAWFAFAGVFKNGTPVPFQNAPLVFSLL